MFNAHVSSKGQVVIPKALRERYGIKGGTVVSFTDDYDGLRLKINAKPAGDDILKSLDDGFGLAEYSGPALSPAEIRARLRGRFSNATEAR